MRASAVAYKFTLHVVGVGGWEIFLRYVAVPRVRATELRGRSDATCCRSEVRPCKRLRCRAIWPFPFSLRVIRETCLPLLCKVSALRVIAFMYPLMGLSVGRVIGIEILPLLMAVSRCFDWT